MLQHVQNKHGFTLNAQLLSSITALTTSYSNEGEHDPPHQAGQRQGITTAPRAQALPNCQKCFQGLLLAESGGHQTLSWSLGEHNPDCSKPSLSPGQQHLPQTLPSSELRACLQ